MIGRTGRAVRWATAALTGTLALMACRRPLPDEDGSGEAEVGSVAEQVAGCWELRPGTEGAAAGTTRRWLEDRTLPRTIGLDTVRMEAKDSDSLYRARSYRGSRATRRPFSAWRPVGADSIRVEAPGALAGVVLRLAVQAERLRGTATVFTDALRPGESARTTGPVEGRPRDCPG